MKDLSPGDCSVLPIPVLHHLHPQSKEADEVLANAEGRWFSFTVSAAETFFVLERKDLANHLAKLECVDTAVTLQSLICDLQDAGEVPLSDLL